MTSPAKLFFQAVLAFAGKEFAQAAQLAQRASAGEPDILVYREAAIYLQNISTVGANAVYGMPNGFAQFIRGGGNIPLYRNLSEALKEIYLGYDSFRLLDIGVGDGLALLPALTPNIVSLDLIEPSRPMLDALCQRLSSLGFSYRPHQMTLQAFAATERRKWDVGQATFCLHAIPPNERLDLLKWLRSHASRLLIAEFDAPAFAGMLNEETVDYFVRRYQNGLSEYAGKPTVTQNFLMPVFFGNFDQEAARLTFEQPISAWQDDLTQAGFAQITKRHLHDYWWAPAYLLDAS